MLEDYLQRLKNFDFPQFINDVLSGELNEFLKELQREQMSTGYDSLNDFLGEYADSTIERKKRKGQPTDRVTLFDSGNFYDKIQTEFEQKEITFDSITDYTKWITKRYTDSVFGLNEKSIDKLQEKLIPIIQNKLYELLY